MIILNSEQKALGKYHVLYLQQQQRTTSNRQIILSDRRPFLIDSPQHASHLGRKRIKIFNIFPPEYWDPLTRIFIPEKTQGRKAK
jgi:hypothetical protein